MPDRPSPATSSAVTAVALAAAGAVHLRFGPTHLDEDALYGAFFLGTGASQLVAAVVVGGVAARGRALSGRLHWVVVGLVTSAEQIGRRPPELATAGPAAQTVGWAIGRLDGGDFQSLDRTGVKVPVTGAQVEFGLFVGIAAERPGTFGIDAVNVGLRYDGQVVEQPFATILRVQIGEQP